MEDVSHTRIETCMRASLCKLAQEILIDFAPRIVWVLTVSEARDWNGLDANI